MIRLALRSTILAILPLSVALAQSPLPNAPHVYVVGRAELDVQPDELLMSVTFSSVTEELEEAKADVDRRVSILLDARHDLGLADGDVSSSSLFVRPEYEHRDKSTVLVGTRVTRNVEITLRDFSLYSLLVRTLVRANVTSIDNTVLQSSSSEKWIAEVQALAMKDALARAERLARDAGKAIGDVHSISEFDLREEELWRLIPRRGLAKRVDNSIYATMRAPSLGSEPFEPGLLTASASVYVVYLLGPR